MCIRTVFGDSISRARPQAFAVLLLIYIVPRRIVMLKVKMLINFEKSQKINIRILAKTCSIIF